MKGYDNRHYYQPDFAQAEVASGDQAGIMNLWNAARAARAKMDARDIQYPWMGLGQNSNSFLSTLIAAMGLTEPPLPGGAPVKPGARSMLLDPKDIEDIQRQFNIGAPRSEDTPNTGSQLDNVRLPSPLDSTRRPPGPVGTPGGRTASPSARDPRSPLAVPGTSGPTSIGGPNGPAPLVPPARSPSLPSPAPTADPGLPQLRVAPEELRNFSPLALPKLSRSDALGGSGIASAVSGPKALAPITPSFGAPGVSPEATSPAVPGAGPIGVGNGSGDLMTDVALAPSSNPAQAPVRMLVRLPSSPSTDPSGSREAGVAPAVSHRARSFPPVRFPLEALLAPDRNRALDEWASFPRRGDPSKRDRQKVGGLLGMIADYMRPNG
ncbi:hypothetical protein JQ604_21955 [Bradyrhizobium jicamae]|uniref:hypothetical protein n=1 Tax=Bradyrhizobium jicamae TaxID=280332 RepID=UPI001BA76D09|nr:hypothetical protein [Bradyrhizobium jicamae]MBR0754860.1 hypothetical protein [Bradyrhizobium jicamae]